eukprot:gnl/TRDRNA2_/TRDRNA2_173214_c2_seq5.p2 gnl/TRDRNA2_/TRDRNA2_173214_c2~~gnl/TRDRNA2_/TRDRNA2_173214_c2_seq5.p2  ORF type:complete len:128 (-),score=17.68 gnl/TRDRNA2_/TRDRNA2_173214_c2_seq5:166-549(-)
MPGHGVPPDDPALSERLTVMVALWPERPGRDGIHGAQSLPPESSVAKWPCLLLGGEYGERKTMVKPQQHTGRPGTLIKPAWLASLPPRRRQARRPWCGMMWCLEWCLSPPPVKGFMMLEHVDLMKLV